MRLSQFRAKYQVILDMFEPAMEKAGAKLLDFSDHHCWEDLCYPFTPAGYPAFIDNSHYMKPYAKYWASVVDVII